MVVNICKALNITPKRQTVPQFRFDGYGSMNLLDSYSCARPWIYGAEIRRKKGNRIHITGTER